jgi:multicomponent K+:H+ antiporter subunit C
MEWLVAGAIGLLIGSGVYLLLARQGFTVVLGLLLLSYGVNLLVFATGRLAIQRPPLDAPHGGGALADPLPQALVLTAIVIGLGMTAFALALTLWAAQRTGIDDVTAADHTDDAPPATPAAPQREGW